MRTTDEAAVERRRLQNRLAQRRRRQKKANLEAEVRNTTSLPDVDEREQQRQATRSSTSSSCPSSGYTNSPTTDIEPRQLLLQDSAIGGDSFEDLFLDKDLDTSAYSQNGESGSLSLDTTNDAALPQPHNLPQRPFTSPGMCQQLQGAPFAYNIAETGGSGPRNSQSISAVNLTKAPSVVSPTLSRGTSFELHQPIEHHFKHPMGKQPRKTKMILHFCAERGDLELLDLILDHGAEIDGVDQSGRTALHHAVGSLQKTAVKRLLDRGADIELADCEGWTPLHVAVDIRSEELIVLLIEEGADLNAATGY